MNIIYSKKDVIIDTKINTGKHLIYHAIILINPKAIILTITSIIMLMKD